MNNNTDKNKEIATRYIKAFNNNSWNTVREVIAPNFIFHHPIGGTVQAGPEGMVGVWADFKASLPDSWHPIPIMIAEDNFLAVLLPTYGHFTGKPYHGSPPTGKWLEYGMINIVRFENGKIAENWFGMDPLVEQQQMGTIPQFPSRQLTSVEKNNLELFKKTICEKDSFDNLTAFGNAVAALGPPQHKEETSTRKIEIYKNINGSFKLDYLNEFVTNPPYNGNPSSDKELSRSLVQQFIKNVINGHNIDMLSQIVSSNILIHPTAMPCESSFYGPEGIEAWLNNQWKSFPDLTFTDYFTVAEGDIVAVNWKAKGTSKGNFLMLQPSGEIVKYTGSSMYRIENERIVEIWETRNTLAIMKQINPDIGGNHHH